MNAFTEYVPKVGDRVRVRQHPVYPASFVGSVGTVTAVAPNLARCCVDLDNGPFHRPFWNHPCVCFYPGEVEALTDEARSGTLPVVD